MNIICLKLVDKRKVLSQIGVEIMNTETKQEIIGIVMCHGENDYGYWEGFSLTEEEEEQIYEILMRHDTEGCSIRGTRNDIANDIKE